VETKLTIEQDRLGWWCVYEHSPIPGQGKRIIVARRDRKEAERDAQAFLKKERDGSIFKAERSVVGA
jgi:porphobilinogen deaminase